VVAAITGVLLGSIRGGGIPSCGERVGVAKGLELSLGRWAAALQGPWRATGVACGLEATTSRPDLVARRLAATSQRKSCSGQACGD
jgi:hypothetical protein